MKYTTLVDLNFYLKHLVDDEEQQRLLASTVTWKLFGPVLREHLDELERLSPSLALEGKPLAQELRETDAEHDGCFRAVHHLLQAYQALPARLAGERGEQARALAQVLVPDAGLTRASYMDEAGEAQRRQARLQGHEALLAAFPVAGGDVGLWVEALNAAGARLATLLSERAQKNVDQLPKGEQGEAGVLRSKLVGALQRFREMLRLEFGQRDDLPPHAEQRVFQFLDEASERRATAAQRAAHKASPEG